MLSVIAIDEPSKWDDIVKSFEDYEVYQLSGYVKAFQIHGDGVPYLFYYKCENNRAINVVMLRDISKDSNFEVVLEENKYYDITTPYGYGGFIIEGQKSEENVKKIDKEFTKYCMDNGIICEFVRFNPMLQNEKKVMDLYEVIELGKTISLNLHNRNQIWNELSSKNRNVIRKAIKGNVKIYWGRSKELIDQFTQMYNKTMDKDNASDYYYFDEKFYTSILYDLNYNSMIFYAVLEEKIISMSMIIFANEKIHYHLSASEEEYLKYAPTNLLLYEVACWGAENGFKTFHLGGGLGSKEDGLYKFKKAFNPKSSKHFAIGKKIIDNNSYAELVKVRNNMSVLDLDSSYFPEYRAGTK